MALLISHRGNINGIDQEKENSPDYIEKALEKGFHVLVDVFLIGQKLIALGCDGPRYATTIDFLKNRKIIVRAQSIECLDFLISNEIHCFYHSHDKCSLTTGGLIWTRPGGNITQRCIFTMPEWILSDITSIKDIQCAGICSNFIELIQNARL